MFVACVECFKFQVEHPKRKVVELIKHLEVLFPIVRVPALVNLTLK